MAGLLELYDWPGESRDLLPLSLNARTRRLLDPCRACGLPLDCCDFDAAFANFSAAKFSRFAPCALNVPRLFWNDVAILPLAEWLVMPVLSLPAIGDGRYPTFDDVTGAEDGLVPAIPPPICGSGNEVAMGGFEEKRIGSE